MADLMTHVESIVRPVRAHEPRKLRMRRELLSHLQSAFDEELARTPADPEGAFGRAQSRLGPPADLTRTLQDSVPAVERILRSPAPAFGPFHRLERRIELAPPGSPITFIERSLRHLDHRHSALPIAHHAVLNFAATVLPLLTFLALVAPFVLAPVTPSAHSDRPFFVGALVCVCAFIWCSGQYVLGRVSRPLTFVSAVGTLALSVLLTHFAITGHPAPVERLLLTAPATLILFVALAAIARLMSVLRRPYDPWLTLNLAR